MLMGDPFVGNVPKKISKEELIQAIRVDIAGELEAITVYDAHAMATDDPRAKAILTSIRDEERQHVGELIHLMEILDPAETQLLAKGKQEVSQLLAQQGQQGQGQPGLGQPIISGDYMQAGGPVGNQGMQQSQGPSGNMQMPQSQGPSASHQGQQGQQGQPGLGQYHNFTYQPRPGNFGHRGPNNW